MLYVICSVYRRVYVHAYICTYMCVYHLVRRHVHTSVHVYRLVLTYLHMYIHMYSVYYQCMIYVCIIGVVCAVWMYSSYTQYVLHIRTYLCTLYACDPVYTYVCTCVIPYSVCNFSLFQVFSVCSLNAMFFRTTHNVGFPLSCDSQYNFIIHSVLYVHFYNST